MENQESNKRIFKTALYLAKDQGYDPWAIFTQAWVESAAFSSVLCEVHNYWGIIFRPEYGSHFVIYDTHEWLKDPKQFVVEKTQVVNGVTLYYCKVPGTKWQKFGDQYLAFTVYLMKIKHMYPEAYLCRADYVKFFAGLKRWSTTPTYTTDLPKKYVELEDAGEFTE